jgi:hypothetical protein
MLWLKIKYTRHNGCFYYAVLLGHNYTISLLYWIILDILENLWFVAVCVGGR